ncbi:MAG: class I SAM-dependent methyltransferase, partial [Deltaproteobacteria bacterium]|nr:class I SAM-dependent methyltransferase [Deltaproteobacteria bacterium]
TPFYDFCVSHGTKEALFKGHLIEQAQLQPGFRVLDVGCGTGTLLLMIKERYAEVEAVGIDGDPKILAIARRKSEVKGAEIRFHHALAQDLPFENASFDRVFTSLVLHHLTADQKRAALKEIYRVLKRGGEMHVADWGVPHSLLMKIAFQMVRMLDGYSMTEDNYRGRLPTLFAEDGFIEAKERARFATLFGTLSLFSARKGGA